MAISIASKTRGSSTTDGTSFATASVTPAANALMLLAIAPVQGSGSTTPTVTGNGLTWVSIDGGEYGGSGSGRQVHLFRALGASPSAGAITMDFGATTQIAIAWALSECTGMDTSGTNGSGAIVQSGKQVPSSSGTGLVVTLSAFASASNAAFGMFSHGTNEGHTPGSGFAELDDVGAATPEIRLQTEWQINDNTVDSTWATSDTRGAIAVEIKAAASVSDVPGLVIARHVPRRRMIQRL